MVAAADFTALYQQAVEERKAQYGPGHPKVAAALLDLALYLKEQGDTAGAVGALRAMVAISKEPLARAEGTLELAALTGVYREVPGALAVLEKAGSVAPARAVALNNLGTAVEERDARLAERLYRAALRGYPAASTDAEYGSVLNNLANLLLNTDRAGAAEPLCRKALGIFAGTLGEEHPRTATATSNLGDVLAAQGKLAAAEAAYKKALAIDMAVHGAGHPDVAASREKLEALQAHRKETGR